MNDLKTASEIASSLNDWGFTNVVVDATSDNITVVAKNHSRISASNIISRRNPDNCVHASHPRRVMRNVCYNGSLQPYSYVDLCFNCDELMEIRK